MARTKQTSKPPTSAASTPPPTASEQAKRLLASNDFVKNEAGGDKAIVTRLVNAAFMVPAWNELNGLLARDEHLAIDFLTTAVGLRRSWSRVSKMPTNEAHEILGEIKGTARLLARRLRHYSAEIQTMVGPRVDLASLIFDVLTARHRSTTAWRIRRLDWQQVHRAGQQAMNRPGSCRHLRASY